MWVGGVSCAFNCPGAVGVAKGDGHSPRFTPFPGSGTFFCFGLIGDHTWQYLVLCSGIITAGEVPGTLWGAREQPGRPLARQTSSPWCCGSGPQPGACCPAGPAGPSRGSRGLCSGSPSPRPGPGVSADSHPLPWDLLSPTRPAQRRDSGQLTTPSRLPSGSSLPPTSFQTSIPAPPLPQPWPWLPLRE